MELPGLSFDILMTGYEVIGDEYLIFLDGSCGILKEIHNFNDENQFLKPVLGTEFQ